MSKALIVVGEKYFFKGKMTFFFFSKLSKYNIRNYILIKSIATIIVEN